MRSPRIVSTFTIAIMALGIACSSNTSGGGHLAAFGQYLGLGAVGRNQRDVHLA